MRVPVSTGPGVDGPSAPVVTSDGRAGTGTAAAGNANGTPRSPRLAPDANAPAGDALPVTDGNGEAKNRKPKKSEKKTTAKARRKKRAAKAGKKKPGKKKPGKKKPGKKKPGKKKPGKKKPAKKS